MKPFFLLFLVLFSCSACTSVETLVFSSNRSGNSDLYTIRSNGKDLKQLTSNPAEEWGPTVLSKNEITFLRETKEGIQRFKLNVKSGEETPLPQPSPCILDDKNILYGPKTGKQLYQCEGNIYVANPDGSNPQNLTQNISGKSSLANWFPSEERIVFTNDQSGNKDIYAINLDGSNLEQLVDHPAIDERPEISSDGTRMIFSSSRNGTNNMDLFQLNLETGSAAVLTQSPEWELIGRWSGDGKTLYFGRNNNGNWDIYAYHLKKGDIHQLTSDEGFDGDPRVLK